MLVVYESRDEVLVCEEKSERDLYKQYFKMDTGRDISDYERYETNDVVKISAVVRVRRYD